MGPGYDKASEVSGGYLPFTNGLCVGVKGINETWLSPVSTNSSGKCQNKNDTMIKSTIIFRINVLADRPLPHPSSEGIDGEMGPG